MSLSGFILSFLTVPVILFCASCSKIERTPVTTTDNPGYGGGIGFSGGGLPEQPDALALEIIDIIDGSMLVFDHASEQVSIVTGNNAVSESSLADDHPAKPSLVGFRDRLKRQDRGLTTGNSSKFTRLSDNSGTVELAGDGLTLNTVSVSGAYLADAWLLKRNSDYLWIQQEELDVLEQEYKGQQIFRFKVTASLRRYDVGGSFIDETSIILGKPRTILKYFAVDSDNNPYYLKYNAGTGGMASLPLLMKNSADLALPVSEEGAFDNPPDWSESMQSFEAIIRTQSPPASFLSAVATREKILQRAEDILNTRWTLSDANFSADRSNLCDKRNRIWRRPEKLNAKTPGALISGPPYKWGGNENLHRFIERIELGDTAGDVCTCRCRKGSACTAKDWCIDPSTAGFDCSGFVSNVWGISYHSTASLHKVGKAVSWKQLKPGDILNSPGRHVRLFTAFAEGAPLIIEAIESSVSCSGVCRKNFRVSELAGYIPYKLKGLREDQL